MPRKHLLTCTLLTLFSSQALSEVPLFNDRGDNYNRFNFIGSTEIAKGAFSLEFRNREESYFTGFVVSSEGVIVFDPLSDSAARATIRQIEQHAPDKPLAAIIYSHLHTDHIAGARVLQAHFGDEAPIIAHQRTARFFKIRQVPFIIPPTERVTDQGAEYRFGNRTVQLNYLGDAHTASILVPVIPELKLAYVCDYANNDVVGWTDLPGINLDEMMAMQRRTLDLNAEQVIHCHGGPGDLSAVERQLSYFTSVSQAAEAALHKGLTEDQTANSIELTEYQHFANYNDWFKGNVRAFYRWHDRKENRSER